MSISPAQMILQVASAEGFAPMSRSRQGSGGASPPAVGSPIESSSPAPTVSSPVQFNTDMRIDNQHQIYYEIVDASTGDEVFEIPPEALREIGESLNVPLDGNARGHSVDVKS